MSSIINLTNRLSELSVLLEEARLGGDTEAVERIEDEIYDVTDELDELTDFEESHKW